MNNLGEKIRILREKRGYSQTEFADKIGVSRQSISKWENGETTPDAHNLKSIANLFNISLDELLEISVSKGFKPKPIHKKLSTLAIVIQMVTVALIVLIAFLNFNNVQSTSIECGSNGCGMVSSSYGTRMPIWFIIYCLVLITIPFILMSIYRKELKKSEIDVDNLLIIAIILIFINLFIGIIHIISVIKLYKEKKQYI